MADEDENVTDLAIGPAAIKNYSRLSYTMWNALAEFIDNSTQSRINYDGIIDDVLAQEGTPLVVSIDYNPLNRTMTIADNSIGMTKAKLVNALRIASPTKDSKGRSRYGMGLKTAACWIGNHWRVETAEWGSGEQWTADIDVDAIAEGTKRIPLTPSVVDKGEHFTRVVISDLNRNLQKRTEETIKSYLGSIYRFDLADGRLKILYRGEELVPPDEDNFDTDVEGKPMRRDIPPMTIGGKPISGWVGVLRKGGRKYGGFSLFQNKRQIQGFPSAWKPRSIFGGVDDEGANNLVAQRLTGVIELDERFKVSHTKDAILFEGDEEEELENFLQSFTKDYSDYAKKRRDTSKQPWSREKLKDLVENLSKEFTTAELSDAVTNSVLPPAETIAANDMKQVVALTEDEKLATYQVTKNLRVVVAVREVNDFEPHVTISAAAEAGTAHVIINRLHPYYPMLESTDAVEECIRQYIYDAIAEYQVSQSSAKVTPWSVRRLKDGLLRAVELHVENVASSESKMEVNVPTPTSKN